MNTIKFITFYSIFGFLFEILLNVFIRASKSSGFLCGPFTPIYYLGYLLIRICNKLTTNKFVFFVLMIILSTFIEFTGGYLLKIVFNKELWNYEKLPLHFGKYVSLFTSIGWGIGALIFNYFLRDKVDSFVLNMNNSLSIFLFIMMIFDFILSLYFR